MLVYIWTLCAAGIGMEVWFHAARGTLPWIKYVSLVLYVAMGWSAAFPPLFRDIRAAMEPQALRLLVGGGLAYTLGVPIFVRGRNLDHAIWHLFVLAGSAMHFASLTQTISATLRGTI